MKKVAPKKKPVSAASTVHIKAGDDHVVGVRALRVLLLKDGDGWFAQGLEIDYASCGATIDETKKAFENGLGLTVEEHLKMYGNLEKLLKVAPQDAWSEYFQAPKDCVKTRYSFIQVVKNTPNKTVASLPFEEIQFFISTTNSDPVHA